MCKWKLASKEGIHIVDILVREVKSSDRFS